MARNPSRRSKHHKRKVDYRELRTRILIVCEGAKTEPLYFRGFPQSKVVSVTVKGDGMNTDSLVESAAKRKRDEEHRGNPYNEVWCVFDRDSFSADKFNRAFAIAKKLEIRIAYSNQAFELWYLLHFDFHTASIERRRYAKLLDSKLGFKYRKNDPSMYGALLQHQTVAIRNAENLLRHHGNTRFYENDPSTTVHRLVIRLNQLVDNG